MDPFTLIIVIALVIGGALVPVVPGPLPLWGRVALTILLEVAAILLVGA